MVAKVRRGNFKSILLLFFNLLKNIDYLIWIPILSLSIIGLLFIYSSSLNVDGVAHQVERFPLFAKQFLFLFIGIFFSIFIRFLRWQDLRSYFVYAIGPIAILMIIVIFLPAHHGNHAWLRLGGFSLQPSELAKPFYIMGFAKLLIRYKEKVSSPLWIWLFLFIGAIPIFITTLQNDMGTASVFIPILFVMLYKTDGYKPVLNGVLIIFFLVYLFTVLCGWSKLTSNETFYTLLFSETAPKIIIPVILSFTIAVSMVGCFAYKRKIYYYLAYSISLLLIAYCVSIFTAPNKKSFGILGKYQIERIVYPFDNSLKLTTSYNIEQARTAIGSGNLLGKGYLKGNLSHRKFVPEQPTDFIFSILAEEWGFLGSFFVLLLYGIFLYRILWMTFHTTDFYANLVQWAIFTLFFYHMIVNIGMNLGTFPVIGIPLMFVSYGGTALLTSFISIGILETIWYNEKRNKIFSSY